MNKDEAVNIIGAGPSGLAAAIVLRKHGFPVRVFEKSSDVGRRFNGDFQGIENWSSEKDVLEQLRDMGIESNFLSAPCCRCEVFAPGIEHVEVKSYRPLFYLVKRGTTPGTLDIGLKEQAQSLGVEIIFNRRLDSFEGKAIVGTGPGGVNAIALGMTFDTDMEDKVAVVLDDDIAPKGYSYLLVNGNQGTIATILYREFGRGGECFQKTVRFFRDNMELDIADERRFGCHVNFCIRDTQIHLDKLFIGESAGFQDGLWGFGMRYAFLSGYLAAKSLIEGSDYDTLWKSALKPMLETSLVNRYVFEISGHAGYRYLTRKLARGDPRAFLRKHYNPSFLKYLLLPLAKISYPGMVRYKNFDGIV